MRRENQRTEAGVDAGKTEFKGGYEELTIGIAAYEGPGVGVSVTIRPKDIVNSIVNEVNKFMLQLENRVFGGQ